MTILRLLIHPRLQAAGRGQLKGKNAWVSKAMPGPYSVNPAIKERLIPAFSGLRLDANLLIKSANIIRPKGIDTRQATGYRLNNIPWVAEDKGGTL